MKKIYTMTNLVKGLMLAALMTVGTTTVSAQATEDKGTYTPAAASDFWMGEAVKAGSFYLYNVGTGIFATNNTPSEKDITKAAVWTVAGSNTYTFKSGDSKLYMEYKYSFPIGSWNAAISTSGSATDFTLTQGTTTNKGNVYKLRNGVWGSYHYFNVASNKYTAASTEESNLNDWILISAAQKDAYADYTSLYNQAIELYGNEKLADREDIKETLKSALESTAASNYDKYTTDAATLKNAIDTANKAIEDITNGINNINGSATNGSAIYTNAAAIYSINGVRNAQLTKGINIVKMSDGKVKKVLVK